MADYTTLIGAEDVRAAGNAMREAAREMRTAASYIAEALREHRQWSEEWLARLEAALQRRGDADA